MITFVAKLKASRLMIRKRNTNVFFSKSLTARTSFFFAKRMYQDIFKLDFKPESHNNLRFFPA